MNAARRLPHYLRQRLLLALIAAHPDGLTNTDMQKKMFLLTRDLPSRGRAPYSFFPYKFGCYSLQCARDAETLQHNSWLQKKTHGVWRADADCEIPDEWRTALRAFMRSETGRLSSAELVRYVYQRYPYFAINRENLDTVLHDENDRERVRRARPAEGVHALCTIGYEGRDFEEYVDMLLQNGVRVLIDVRANPLSRKTGFSKGALQNILPRANIEYRHLPALGIAGELRRDLPDAESRRRLFAEYRARLPQLSSSLEEIHRLFEDYGRVALTCFEAAAADCHRGCIGEEMSERFAGLSVEHL